MENASLFILLLFLRNFCFEEINDVFMFAKVLKTSMLKLFKSVRVARPWTKQGDNSKLGP